MKFFNNRLIISTILILFVPILIKSQNIKLGYKINNLRKEVKKLELENQYLKKNLYTLSNLSGIKNQISNMGFEVPQPYMIVMLDELKEENNKINFFAKLKENLLSSTRGL